MTITGKFVEGTKAYLAVNDVAIDEVDVNGASDQLAASLGPLGASFASAAFFDDSGANKWYFRAAIDPPYWTASAQHVSPLVMPLGTLRAGQKITGVSVVVNGDYAGGTILLRKNLISAAGAAKVTVHSYGTDPWNVAGVWFQHNSGALTEVAVSQTAYWVEFTGAAAGTKTQVLGAFVTAQFGN